MNNSKKILSKSVTHKMLSESIIRRYIQTPNIKDIGGKMGKYINLSNKKLRCLVSCVLKLINTANRVRFIRIKTRLSLEIF